MTMDTFLEQHPGIEPTVPKIEVEGAAVSVLDGARDMLQRHRPLTNCEFHSNDEWTGVTQRLESLGYRGITFQGERRISWCEPDASTSSFLHVGDPRVSALNLEVEPGVG